MIGRAYAASGVGIDDSVHLCLELLQDLFLLAADSARISEKGSWLSYLTHSKASRYDLRKILASVSCVSENITNLDILSALLTSISCTIQHKLR